MSTKDMRYFRQCPICSDKLDGTDDGVMVFECLKEGLEKGVENPCCTLCGEEVSTEEAKEIVTKGNPKLRRQHAENRS